MKSSRVPINKLFPPGKQCVLERATKQSIKLIIWIDEALLIKNEHQDYPYL